MEGVLRHGIVNAVAAGDGIADDLHGMGLGGGGLGLAVALELVEHAGGHGGLAQLDDPHMPVLAFRVSESKIVDLIGNLVGDHALAIDFNGDAGVVFMGLGQSAAVVAQDGDAEFLAGEGELHAGAGPAQPQALRNGHAAAQEFDVSGIDGIGGHGISLQMG